MNKIIILLSVFLSSMAFADGNVMGVHGITYHSPNIECDNGHNPGVYFSDENGVTFGTYYNSCKRQSTYVGYKTEDWYGVGLMLMAVTGYDWAITPAIFPTAAIEVGDIGLRVSGGSLFGYTVIHLSIERRF